MDQTIILMFGTRLLIAILLGMVIGAERIIAHKTAGMRTYALVAMGSALFASLSELIGQQYGLTGFNPVLIPSAVISGIGFLGTGIMIQRQGAITGLTTASGLWVAAGIGLCVGYGFTMLAVIATALTLFVFIVLWMIEQQLKKTHLYEKIENLPIQEDGCNKI